MKKLLDFLIALSLFVFANVAYGQSSSSYESSFTNGKELLKLGKYGLAMQAFKPLTNSLNDNPYSKISSYYYAICAYNEGQKYVGRDMFLQITNKYPNWENIDEAYLWLTKIYFDEGDFKQGLTYASKIEKTDVKKSANQLKKDYLQTLEYEQLQSMLSDYPSEKDIAARLADEIILLPINIQDRDLLENIVSVFELDKNKYRVEDDLKSIRKAKYQVAVMLPFMKEEIKYNSQHLSNEFVIELYEGILLGASQLKSRGINLEIYLYDTKRDEFATDRLLKQEEMKHMDLIIGPLYPEPVKKVSEFAFNHRINMINPLSTNSEIVGNNPYSFLFMPSAESQAMVAADFAQTNFTNKNAFIFHGSSSRDSALAYSYKKEIENRGFQVCHFEMVPTEGGKKILDILTNTVKIELDASEFDSLIVDDKVEGNLRITEKDFLTISSDSISHVFVASNDPALVANAITGLETRRDSIALIGSERWLGQRVISLGGLNRLRTYLIAPTYVDKTSYKFEQVTTLCAESFNTFPTRNFFIGYEVIMTAGKLLQKSGTLFQFDPGINDFIPGELFVGTQYGDQNCNKIVPILNYSNAELILANPR